MKFYHETVSDNEPSVCRKEARDVSLRSETKHFMYFQMLHMQLAQKDASQSLGIQSMNIKDFWKTLWVSKTRTTCKLVAILFRHVDS